MQLKIINRKNYIPLVCVLYTCWVLFKLITEELIWHMKDVSYVSNLLWGFVLTALLIALLKLGEYCSDWPLWLVILLQYGIFLAVVLGSTWISGHFRELADTAYRDEFRSTTIPFGIVAVLYYWKCFHELKRSNEILAEVNGNGMDKGQKDREEKRDQD